MSTAVHWLVKIEIAPENLTEFKAVMNEMIVVTKEESGTLAYEWCFNEDETYVGLYERFRDSEAAIIHLNNFAPFAERFTATCSSMDMIALGKPNDEVKAMLTNFTSNIVEFKAGFERC
jgi:quinol monooxygenase YgiN